MHNPTKPYIHIDRRGRAHVRTRNARATVARNIGRLLALAAFLAYSYFSKDFF